MLHVLTANITELKICGIFIYGVMQNLGGRLNEGSSAKS
jgi:hypothetical protein